MADKLTVTSQKLTRDQLSKILPDQRSIRFFENLISDLQSAASSINDRDVVNVWTKNQSTAQFDLTDAPIVALDASQSNSFRLITTQAVGATRKLANPTKATPGMWLFFEFVQPASGGPCALTLDTNYDVGQGSAPTLSTTPGARDLALGYFDGLKLCLFPVGTVSSEAFVTLIDAAVITPQASRSTNFLLVMSPGRTTRTINIPPGVAPGAILNFNVVVPGSGYSIVWAAGSPGYKWGRGGLDAQPIGTQVAGTDTYSFQVETDGSPHGVMIGQSGPSGPGYQASSVTSLATGTGSKAFTTQYGLAYSTGAYIRATSIATGDYMEGTVASYVLNALTVTMTTASGSGTHADWTINLAGQQGPPGTAGSPGSSNFAGTSTTSQTVGTGSLTFTTQSGLAYQVGARVRISSSASPSNYLEGVCTAYSGTSITVLSDTVGGTGTFAAWNLNIAGNPGTSGSSGGGPTFAVRRITSNQSITSSSFTVAQFNATDWDTATAWDGTNFRFKPLVSGYYQFNWAIEGGGSSASVLIAELWKNGASNLRGSDAAPRPSGGSSSGAGVVFLNGSTDYVDVRLFLTATSPVVQFDGGRQTVFNGIWLRS